ncbi:hypothetical protein [Hymenobacter latericus]|uniref:hypothetical protein n=1 Tax=Hymenobacter sp. YIM 151858-1 TaxID=2987688 RepID=UPI002227D3F9|nr:hypothetical protein [Hymenobacter sp. YIM 151858-1]UYZ60120.1 hypothetical protein OIS50_04790 [Hymenobacter sp. YIM 151858-1]
MPLAAPAYPADLDLSASLSPLTDARLLSVLTDAEVLAGCCLFPVPDNSVSPALWAGEGVIARPVPASEWDGLATGQLLLLTWADEDSDAQTHYHFSEYLRVVRNEWGADGVLTGIRAEAGALGAVPYRRAQVRAVYQVVRRAGLPTLVQQVGGKLLCMRAVGCAAGKSGMCAATTGRSADLTSWAMCPVCVAP